MRIGLPFVLAGCLAAGLVHDADAVVPRGDGTAAARGLRVTADSLTAMPAAGTKPLRTFRAVTYGAQTRPAWRRFAAAAGGAWTVSWDAATAVPTRIWGTGIPAPGASASAVIAEAYARGWLAQHLDLLAPGSTIADFVLVADRDDGEIRSIGFVQLASGHRVVGGQVSFSFKRDRLFVIGSTALPNVRVAASSARARLAPAALAARATVAVRAALALPDAPVTAPAADVIVPLVAADAVLGYRLAAPVTIDGRGAGKYLAYVDPVSGEPLAVQQLNSYATGTLLYRSVDRYPGRGRIDLPAATAHVKVSGVATTVNPDGTVQLPTAGAQPLLTSVDGELVGVVTKLPMTEPATTTLQISPGVPTVWDASAVETDDAQLVTYTSLIVVKTYAREHLDPGLALLDAKLNANVNLDDACNAFFDGESVNFFKSSPSCENTGRVSDVVYHEFGHAIHASEVIAGVGSFDYGMSEGVADFIAASITGDPGLGRGFHRDDEPLRDIDPPTGEARYPQDLGEAHTTGLIFSGVFWDLRKAAIEAMGDEAGVALTNKLLIAALQRGVDIPSTLVEALAADDDDGDLANGTPHECMIRAAYARHGMRTVSGQVELETIADGDASVPLRLTLADLSARCPGVDVIDHATLSWLPADRPDQPAAGSLALTMIDATHYTGLLPLPNNAALQYQATVTFTDGSTVAFPDNRADPFAQIYRGDTIPLYCTNFDVTDPFLDGWTKGPATNDSAFEWGVPVGGPSDPAVAYSGTKILAQNLAGNYAPMTEAYVAMPAIDAGQWSDVRLQFRRWLGTEDSYFDHARILVNDQVAWINASDKAGDDSSLAHVDKEWRFVDLLVSPYTRGQPLRIEFRHDSDPGLEFGGWALDDVCVVANIHSICGDGVRSPTESCDDGAANANEPDACRTYCLLPACGDGIVDGNEECDSGGNPDDKTCSSTCELVPIIPDEDGGCCSATTGGSAAGAGGLAMMVALVLGTRRRRRRRLVA